MRGFLLSALFTSHLFGLNLTDAIAQSAMPKAKKDSLWLVWNDASVHDTMRILAMKEIAWDGYLYTQPDSAYYYAQMQYDLAEKMGRTGGMADALNTQGSAMYVKGDLDKAIELYSRSMKMREKQGNSQAVAASLNNLGNIHFMRGDLEGAMRNYSRCLEVMEQLGDTRGMAVSLSNIADTHKEQGAFDKALSFYGRSMKISEETGDMQGVSYALDNIGTIHRAKGDLGQAVANYMKSLKHSEARGDSADMAASYNHLGNAYGDMGEDSLALAYHGHGLRISTKAGYAIGESTSLVNMGKIYYGQGDLDRAMDFFTRSLQIKENMKDAGGMALCLNNIGNIHQDRGDFAAAKDHYNRSLALHEDIGDPQGIALSLYNLGSIHLLQGEQGKALVLGQRSLSIAQEVGDVKLTRDAAQLLYRCHRAAGRTAQALDMYELHMAMRDSIRSTDNQKKVMRQRFQYDYEKKEAVLKAEQEAKDAISMARIRSQRMAMMGMAGGGVLLLGLGVSGFMLYRQRQRNAALAQSIAARDAERNRLSRELHDGVAGDLLGLQMAVDGGKTMNMGRELGRLRDEIRHISHDLAMPDIQHTSLPEMADYLIGRWRHVGREVALFIEPKEDALWQLPPDKALHLYRILQEGLINALHHAPDGTLVKVRLLRTPAGVELSIENPFVENGTIEANGIGLNNLKERAELIGATISFGTQNGVAALLVTL